MNFSMFLAYLIQNIPITYKVFSDKTYNQFFQEFCIVFF